MRGGAGGWGVSGASRGMGVSPTHAYACTCMHMHIRTCIHVQKLQMAADMKASMFSMISMFNMHVHVCVHACACVCAWDIPHTPLPTPTPIHPSATPPGGWTSTISKNSITLELIKIFQFHLKI